MVTFCLTIDPAPTLVMLERLSEGPEIPSGAEESFLDRVVRILQRHREADPARVIIDGNRRGNKSRAPLSFVAR